jgi:hypothetical protein
VSGCRLLIIARQRPSVAHRLRAGHVSPPRTRADDNRRRPSSRLRVAAHASCCGPPGRVISCELDRHPTRRRVWCRSLQQKITKGEGRLAGSCCMPKTWLCVRVDLLSGGVGRSPAADSRTHPRCPPPAHLPGSRHRHRRRLRAVGPLAPARVRPPRRAARRARRRRVGRRAGAGRHQARRGAHPRTRRRVPVRLRPRRLLGAPGRSTHRSGWALPLIGLCRTGDGA